METEEGEKFAELLDQNKLEILKIIRQSHSEIALIALDNPYKKHKAALNYLLKAIPSVKDIKVDPLLSKDIALPKPPTMFLYRHGFLPEYLEQVVLEQTKQKSFNVLHITINENKFQFYEQLLDIVAERAKEEGQPDELQIGISLIDTAKRLGLKYDVGYLWDFFFKRRV
ncbi:hypothetical protein L596_021910 [Steinernema carpocapsae]|uniref:Uncharacterized protein n=1 Tax=Steinernema carpocapsae TaxID=34508 RepID=A0A4V6A021_STECR|nr:hypothetical protein L596_021910 [Steinernema carpocapsae]